MARTKRDWIADCEFKRRHIEARKLATSEEIASFWPRSKSAPFEAWIFCFGGLCRLIAREEQRVANLDFSDADARTTRALVAEPISLTLYPPGGALVTVSVYPKSHHALEVFFHNRDGLLANLAARIDVLREKGGLADHELLERATEEATYQQRLCAWAACTEGPGLPAEIWAGRAEIPEPWASVTPADLLRIHQAYVHVNHTQLEALEVLVQAGKRAGRDRPSWSIFFGSLATKMNIPAERLMRDHALVSLLATVKLSQHEDEPESQPAEPAGVA